MELLDIYTPNGIKTGRTAPRGTKPAPGEYYLIVHLCVFNSAGQLLIQQRSPQKKGWPGKWDLSAGGHAQTTEDAYTAVLREAREELGVDASACRYVTRTSVPQVLEDFFILTADLDCSQLILQKEELSCVKWASQTDILTMLRDDVFVPYSEELIHTLFRAVL